jgi:arginase family enzyme
MFYTEIGGLTRNKRCFTLKELERQRKAKGKDIIELAKNDDVNKQVSDEKAAKFFKIIKHSEYSVVDQLKKTHA